MQHPSLYLRIFLFDLRLHDIPQGTCDAYGRISAAHNTDHQRQGEFSYRGDSHHKQQEYHDKGSQRSIDTSRQSLGDTAVDQLLHIRFLFGCCQVLTDTVKDNDRRIDRVTHDRKHTGNKGITHGYSGYCIEGQDYQHVVKQGHNCAACEPDILETQ